ncbi:MAG TPA: CHC2 zinc finger domain-containing protein [Anaerolineae bacterium]|nr:CHC2 zinc finger domain-containing protein [Anaerolineae bacterium]
MGWTREEIDRIKAAVRVEDVAARYVPSLRRVGERLVGLCPFHDDTEPSLNIWPASQSWYCFGACRMGGDVIDFLQQAEGIGFVEALDRLEQEAEPGAGATPGVDAYREEVGTPIIDVQEEPLDAEDHAILNAAAEIYYRTLMTNRQWRRWVGQRGISLDTMRHFHVGYSSGRRLAGYLQWRRLSLDKACKLGLHCEGLEHLRYRIIIPVMEEWRTPFLIGRATREGQRPKYLGLARPKVPMADVGQGGAKQEAIVVEGPFDLMVLHEWGYQERFDLVALIGTGVKRSWLPALERYERIIVATDRDEAGDAAAAELAERLPGRVVRPVWPAEYEDVGALGQVREGRAILAAALAEAVHNDPPLAPAVARGGGARRRSRQERLLGTGP